MSKHKWTNDNCNCYIGFHGGLTQEKNGKLRCTHFGEGDCCADSKFTEFQINCAFPRKNGTLIERIILFFSL